MLVIVREKGRKPPKRKGQAMNVRTKARCVECGRVFDLLDEEDASEFYNGHDCEDNGNWDAWNSVLSV